MQRSFRPLPVTIVAAALVGATAPAAANDSTAAIGAGGLQLIENYQVHMAREDLTISSDRVTVRYVFHNESEDDVETLVAFPMPAIDMRSMYESDLGPLGTDTPNYMDFTVTVDGQPVEPAVESRATVLGVDVTDRLAELGLPVAGFDVDMLETLRSLPPETRTALEAEGISQFDEYEGSVEAFPTWTFQTIYYWPQRFAAGADTVIEHSYRPIYGATFFGSYDVEEIRTGEASYWNRFCIGEETLAPALEKAGDLYLFTRAVEYILVTGNNWAGPIGTFHLTIEAAQPGDLVATCMEGLAQTGPATWELTRTDFRPQEDLSVLFLEDRADQ